MSSLATFAVRASLRLAAILAAACLVISTACSEEPDGPPAPRAAPAAAATAADADAAGAGAAGSAGGGMSGGGDSATVAAAPDATPLASTAPTTARNETCCTLVDNPELKGRLGRLVVKFPEGAEASNTRVRVIKPGTEDDHIKSGFGPQEIELLPNRYTVEISGQRIDGVEIVSRKDTVMKTGALHVNAGAETQVVVTDATGAQRAHSGYGEATIGLPPGTYKVEVAGATEEVKVEDGKVTEF